MLYLYSQQIFTCYNPEEKCGKQEHLVIDNFAYCILIPKLFQYICSNCLKSLLTTIHFACLTKGPWPQNRIEKIFHVLGLHCMFSNIQYCFPLVNLCIQFAMFHQSLFHNVCVGLSECIVVPRVPRLDGTFCLVHQNTSLCPQCPILDGPYFGGCPLCYKYHH